MSDDHLTIARHYDFQAAHYLPGVPDDHKCAEMHGHTYEVELHISGEVDPTTGMILDYGILDSIWEGTCHSTLDHTTLNEVDGLENPTVENIAPWIADHIQVALSGATLEKVVLREGPRAECVLEMGEQ